MIEWSALPDTIAVNPIQGEDGFVLSHTTDGGVTYTFSKFGTIDELMAYVVASFDAINGTLDTIAMFTPDGDSVGDSPLTVDSGNVQLLNGNMSVGVAADPDTNIYVESTDLFPLYIFQEYTGGSDTDAIFGSSQGVNTGVNTGIIGRASKSTLLNVGIYGKAGTSGTAKNPEAEGFLQVGSFSQASGSTTDKIAGAFISSNGNTTVDQFSIVAHATSASSGDAIGAYIETSSTGGTSYVGQFKDGTEGVGKVLTSVTADGKAQWENATSGWFGSETRIKIAPWDVVSYNDKDGVSIQDDGGVVNDAAAKITTMVTGVFIPTGYRAVNFKINASANIAVELFESQIWDSTAVSKGAGNANSEINITNVNSTATNYLSIIIVEAGNDIYGGYITIEKI